jgi:putative DNA primase/helicase
MMMNQYSPMPCRILALGKSADGDRFLKVEVFVHGQRKTRLLSMRDLQASSDKAINQLDAPLLTRSTRTMFLEQAQQAFQTRKPTFNVSTNSGWSGNVFVLPNGVCIPRTVGLETCLPVEIRGYGDKFGCLGTLERWDRIPELAKGNSRFMLAVALAFTGPVVGLLRLESPMIQLFGTPGSGKTSMGAAAGAVWGGGHDGLFLQSWNHTLNNAERLAAGYHSTFLPMDETRTADQSQAAKTPAILQLVMRLAGGQVKGRMNDDRPPLRFETPLLSLSNESLDEMAQKCGAEIDDAHRGRLIDVPLASGVVGAFESLHGFENHGAFSAELQNIARHHHGRAAREFLRLFAADLREDKPAIVTWLRGCREWHLKRVRRRVVSAGRDLERIHQKFATIYTAGALAIDYEILPWSIWELSDALLQCEQAHVDHVARFVSSAPFATRPRRPVDPLESLRQHVRQNRSNFVDLSKGLIARSTGHNHNSCPGYINRGPGGSVELLFSNDCLLQLCGGFSQVKKLKDELDKAGWLIKDSKRGVTRRPIWGDGGREDRVYVTAVREKAFEAS